MIIGITGGIGSGKSTVAHALAEYTGWTLYDTDSEAKRLIVEDLHVRSQIETLFGEDVYDGDTYLTRRVAERVFANPDLLQHLNAIVHPAVREDILRRHHAQPTPHCPLLVESAILFESGLDAICDKTIAILSPLELRIERIMERDHLTLEKVQARIAAQMSDEEREQRADICIHYTNRNQLTTLCPYIVQHL